MIRRPVLCLAAALALAAPTYVHAANTTDEPAVTEGDMPTKVTYQQFVEMAGRSNNFEIAAAKVAVERTKDAEVKKFAEQMITDHGKAGLALNAAAGVTQKAMVPVTLDAAGTQKVDLLKAASDTDFDKTYIDQQVEAHREAVALFTSYSLNGDRGNLKDYAGDTLPTLKQHYEMAQMLQKRMM